MLALLLTLAVPAEDLPSRLRHLESAAAAWSPAPCPDGTRVAFLTTMFGGRQAASIALEGGYPTQLTDEPGGIAEIRYLPSEPRQLLVVALREDRRRLLLMDEDGAPPAPLDAAAGDQFPGGFTRDGKKFFYAVREGAKVSLRSIAMDTRKVSEVVPPPPAAGAQRAVGSLSLDEAFSGLFALGPLSPDGRSIVALVVRSGSEAVVLVDLQSARAELLTPDKAARFRQPRFSPDGRTLYVLTDAGRSALGVDAITVQDRTRRTVYAPGNPIDAFAVSDDGHRLAVAVDSTGLDVFLLLDLPSLRVQPLAAPPAGALAGGIVWDRPGERLLFGWRLADDTTDVWQLRLGRGAPTRLTRSPRPALSRDAIPRPTLVRAGEAQAWLWRPRDLPKPRIAVLISETPTRPVFDKRIAALNFAGLAVLAVNGPGAQRAALAFLKAAEDLDPRDPLLLNPDGLPVEDPSRWSGVVNGPRKAQSGHELDPDDPDLRALVRYVRKGGGSL
jgi:dipeptidyl aminopeptidase/acylaminoacyl peptidase